MLFCVLELREQLEAYCTEQGNQKAAKFRDILWLKKLACLASIFDHFNEVKLSLQVKGGGIFRATSKINALKLKIPLWKNNVLSNNFNDFPLLRKYMREYGWGFEGVSLENNISTLIVAHLNLLSEDFAAYFSKDDDKRLEENSWIMQPFIDEPTENEEMLELRADLNQKVSFREMDYSMFGVFLLKFPDMKS